MIINITPLIFIIICEYLTILCVFLRIDVNIAQSIIITHCPKANENNSEIENNILFDTVAIAIMLASIGVEQGLETSAKNTPTKNGNKNKLPESFLGIFFTIAGIGISMNSNKPSPIIISTEANSNITIGEAKFVKIFPVAAQITPIILRISDNPNEKDSI